MLTVDLNAFDLQPIGAALILLRPSGVQYKHQAGGTCCHQKTAEGVYVPLPGFDLSEESEVERIRGPHHLEPHHAADVNALCARLGVPFRISLKAEDLLDSCEAWVRGTVCLGGKAWSTVPAEAYGHAAVLLWDNSD